MNKLSRIKAFSVFFVMLFIMLLSSGCWDSIDINKKEIVTTVLLDYKDEEILFILEIAKTEVSGKSENSSGGITDFKIVEGKGKDLPDAKNNLVKKLKQPLYLSGVRAIMMTERFAKLYLIEYLHRFRADESYRKKIDTIIIRDEPEELLKITKEKNESLGFICEGIIKTLDEQGKSFKRTTMRLLENISTEYTGILVPCMGINGKEVGLVGYSIINDNKVNGFLPIDETKGLVLLKADKPIAYYRIPYKDMNLTVEVVHKKRKVKPHYKNQMINFDVNLEYKAKLLYGDKKGSYNFQEEDAKALGELLKELIKEDVSSSISLSQTKFNCDYYQFDDEFRIKYPVEFDRMNWYEEYPKIVVNYNIKIKMSTTWTMDYS